jgi:predicted transcriptional regulator
MSQDMRSIRVPGQMYATLQQYAKKRDLTMKAAICQAIRLLTTRKKFI